jgi:hypothetical protein
MCSEAWTRGQARKTSRGDVEIRGVNHPAFERETSRMDRGSRKEMWGGPLHQIQLVQTNSVDYVLAVGCGSPRGPRVTGDDPTDPQESNCPACFHLPFSKVQF